MGQYLESNDDVVIVSNLGGGADGGDIIFKSVPAGSTDPVERGRIASAGAGFTIPAITPGLNGITIKDGNGNIMYEVENIALDASHYSPAIVFGSSYGRAGAGGRTWSMGIDTAAATPYRDFFIAKVGGVDGSLGSGNVYDFIYANHRGTSPPTLSIGNSSAFTPAAQVGIIMAADSSGNVLDTTLSSFVIHTALISGGVPSNQTQPAMRVTTWQSASDRMHIEADGSINLYDAGGTIQITTSATAGSASFKGTSLNVGAGAFGSTSHNLYVYNGASNADIQVQTTAGGTFLIQALNASGTVNVWTTNNSDLLLGTNGVARLTIAKTTGGLSQAYSQTLVGATGDVTLTTQTPVIAGAFTATRLNYLQVQQPTGAATITDAAVFQFDAAIGTHKAVDAATTKTTPGAVTAWIKVNLNGTIHYMPAYASKTT